METLHFRLRAYLISTSFHTGLSLHTEFKSTGDQVNHSAWVTCLDGLVQVVCVRVCVCVSYPSHPGIWFKSVKPCLKGAKLNATIMQLVSWLDKNSRGCRGSRNTVFTAAVWSRPPRSRRLMKNTLLATVALKRCLKTLPMATSTDSSLSSDSDPHLAPQGRRWLY